MVFTFPRYDCPFLKSKYEFHIEIDVRINNTLYNFIWFICFYTRVLISLPYHLYQVPEKIRNRNKPKHMNNLENPWNTTTQLTFNQRYKRLDRQTYMYYCWLSGCCRKKTQSCGGAKKGFCPLNWWDFAAKEQKKVLKKEHTPWVSVY